MFSYDTISVILVVIHVGFLGTLDSLFYVSLQLEDTVMVCFRISSCYLLCVNELLLVVDSSVNF